MKTLAASIRKFADNIQNYWPDKLQEKYDIKAHVKEPGRILDPIIIRQIYQALSMMPAQLVRDCGVKNVYIDYRMGPSLSRYPNHGYYINQSVTLNSNIFEDPDQPTDFVDSKGYFVSRAVQTIWHEFFHSYDAYNGDLSLKPEWLKLSGWSKDSKPGLKRLIINEPGMPPVIGEWFYLPSAGFPRFYGKRNPEDDFADFAAFYIAGLHNNLPENKLRYFNHLLSKYLK